MQHISPELISLYHAGKCNPEQKLQVEQWLLQEDADGGFHSNIQPTTDARIEQNIWQGIRQALALPVKPASKIRRIFLPAAAAACLAAITFTGIRLFQHRTTSSSPTALHEKQVTYSAPLGKLVKLVLPDNSIIHLIGGSIIQYPKQFRGKTREIVLNKGEIFLEVTHRPEQPFTVHSAGTAVRVLGTKFNIQNRQQDSLLAVTLAEGSIQFSAGNHPAKILHPGEQLLFNKSTGMIQNTATVNLNMVTGWIKRNLEFDQQPLKQVLNRLQDLYGVTITINGRPDLNKKLTGSFNDMSLESILNMITFSTQVRFSLDKNTVTVY